MLYSSTSVVVITTAQLPSTKPKLRFCAGSNAPHGMLEIRDGEDLWQWSRLEIRLNAFRQSTVPQKQFIIIIFPSFDIVAFLWHFEFDFLLVVWLVGQLSLLEVLWVSYFSTWMEKETDQLENCQFWSSRFWQSV